MRPLCIVFRYRACIHSQHAGSCRELPGPGVARRSPELPGVAEELPGTTEPPRVAGILDTSPAVPFWGAGNAVPVI